MKRNVIKKMLPFLISVCMMAGTVSAAELAQSDMQAIEAEEVITVTDEAEASVSFAVTVSKPVISQLDEVVTIKTATEGATIYYTTDGTTPSETNGTKIAASAGTFAFYKGTVKAIAVKKDCTSSEVATTKVGPVYTSAINPPSFAVKGVFNGRNVTFNTADGKGDVYYAAGTSALTLSDKKVKAGGSVEFSDFYGSIFARTYKDHKWSNPSRLILKIPVCNAPTVTKELHKITLNMQGPTQSGPTTGHESYVDTGCVLIKTTTPNCMIIYTTDGTTPSLTNGTRAYGSQVHVENYGQKQVKAIAVRSCFTNSNVTTYNY